MVTSPAQSPAGAELNRCPGGIDGRDLVIPLYLQATVESGLSADVTIQQLGGASALSNGGIIQPLFASNGAITCAFGASDVDFGQIPGQGGQASLTIYLILLDAQTPSSPNPSLKRLTSKFELSSLDVELNGNVARYNLSGPQVITCNASGISVPLITISRETPHNVEIDGVSSLCGQS
jgi:hypothetical protein